MKELSELFQEIDYQGGEGFNALVRFEGWRIAMNRCVKEAVIGENLKMGQHLCTDEVFVLLSGEATMLIADGDEQPEKLHAIKMVPHRLYNVRKGVFHQLIPQLGAHLLIVENDNTSPENSRNVGVSKQQLAEIIELLG